MFISWFQQHWAHLGFSVFIIVSSTVAIDRAPDLMGSYCATRSHPFQCCKGRSDSCAAPILDTRCYCDQFCKTTTNNDCCPDYEEVCEGMSKITKVCFIDGQTYQPGQKFRRNCNVCHCNEDGEVCCDLKICVTDKYLLKQIKGMSSVLGWYPANYSQFWGRKYDDILSEIASTKGHSRHIILAQRHAQYLASFRSKAVVPEEFDARITWPRKISPIVNQGQCNTAWALSTVSTINDRLRIQTNGSDIVLSTEELIDCSHSTGKQKGCLARGQLDRAWNYIRRKGLHSAEDYRREVEFQCSNSTKRSTRYRSGPLFLTFGEVNIQKEIMDTGPVQATMKIFRDFFSYRGGVYRRLNNDLDEDNRSGFHAVKIIGWGIEQKIKYWIVANSWGTEWGENGFFRIQRGTNECDIERFIFSAWGSPIRPLKSRRRRRKGDQEHFTEIRNLQVIARPLRR